MNYIARYQNPYDQDGTTEEGTICTESITLQTSSNMEMTDEQVREVLRRHLRERYKITEIKEEKIRIE